MAGAGGVTSISIEGDQDAGQIYVPRAAKLLRRLVERVNLGGVQTASDFLRLDDTAYCYAIVAGHVAKAVIVVEGSREVQYPVPPPAVVPQIPDFYSGVVLGGVIPVPPVTTPPTPKTLQSFWPTPGCARLFGLSGETQPVQKLTVEPFDEFSGVLGPSEEYQVPPYSQYVKLKPTMYSGSMRGVVQLLMGFGRQQKKSLYDKTPPPIGTTRDRKKATEKPTPYQTDVQKDGLQIRYDWRWYRTHGITFDEGGVPWLVEIGNTRGIVAMPLPLNKSSQIAEFRPKLEKMGDHAGIYALDKLGGFPTGESFPGKAFDSWVRAGRVLQLAKTDELDAFYSHGAFSSALGWAFSDSGREAHNTCVSSDPDYFQTAYHFAAFLNIGKMKDAQPAPNAAALKQRFQSMQGDERYPAVMWKIDHMPATDVDQWVGRAWPISELFDDLDQLTIDPLAVGTASVQMQEKGRLYKLGTHAQYELKFPSPELGFLVSWDMQPAISTARFHGRCDTTVHVFFVGEQLKYVRFFNDQQTKPVVTVSDDTDGCELMGTFTRATETGTLALPIMVYSNDLDDRAELSSSRTLRVTNGKDLGYSTVAAADDILYPVIGYLSRKKRFKVCVDSKSWSGEMLQSAMVVPFYDRCAYYYAKAYGASTYSHSVACTYRYQADPWGCDTWRNFPGFSGHWAGGIDNGHWISLDQHPDGCGPVTARTVRAPGAHYDTNAGPCADFADQGAWCFTCDNADGMLYDIPEPPLPPPEYENDTSSVPVTSWIVSACALTPLRIAEKDKTWANYMNPWFVMSPDPETNETQYMDETHSAFGDSAVMRYYDQPNGSVLTRGGPQPPNLDKSNATFIGVL